MDTIAIATAERENRRQISPADPFLITCMAKAAAPFVIG
jgi:hypothetical protein